MNSADKGNTLKVLLKRLSTWQQLYTAKSVRPTFDQLIKKDILLNESTEVAFDSNYILYQQKALSALL
ncbi:hypothetical protein LN893_06785 [Pontibacter sp. XAAS-A31]|nr:hypothetical protein [Pontibacter harenae]